MKELLSEDISLHIIIHVLRNPNGWSEESQRKVRLAAADKLEQIEKVLTT